MSKQITMTMWSCIIPDRMFSRWVKKDWIPNAANCFIPSGDKTERQWQYVLDKDGKRGSAVSRSEKLRLNHLGWKDVYTRYCVSDEIYDKMQDEINEWYTMTFDYVEDWLKKEKFINIEKGSFRGSFCAEKDPKCRAVTQCGAPLAKKGNKLAQLKEKFGMIVAYFENLGKGDKEKIEKFAKYCEKKFDCKTRFC